MLKVEPVEFENARHFIITWQETDTPAAMVTAIFEGRRDFSPLNLVGLKVADGKFYDLTGKFGDVVDLALWLANMVDQVKDEAQLIEFVKGV